MNRRTWVAGKGLVPVLLLVLLVLAACSQGNGETATAVPPTAVDTVVPTSTPQPAATAEPTQAAPDLAAFQDNLVSSMVAGDLAQMADFMSDEFAVGAWASEWQLYSPEDAANEFFATYLPASGALEFEQRTAEEITDLLAGQPAEGMLGPTVDIASFLFSSGWGPEGSDEAILFITEENGGFLWRAFLYTRGTFAQATSFSVAAPVGLSYRVVEQGLFLIDADGAPRQLAQLESALPSPDGRFAAYTTEERQLALINTAVGSEELIGSGAMFSGFFLWGNRDTLLVGVWLDPNEADGPNLGHMATLDVTTGALQILDEERLSGNRPAMAPDGQWVAFDVFVQEPLTGQLYHPDGGLQTFAPAEFTGVDALAQGQLFNPGWSPDGTQIAWLASTGERVYLQVFDLEGQTASELFDWDPARFGGLIPSPVWSPDGQWIAIEVLANGPEGSGVWLVAVDGSGEQAVDSQGSAPTWVNAAQLVYNKDNSGVVHLFDINDGASYPLDLPAGSFVAGFVDPALLSSEAIPAAETEVGFVQALQDVTMYDGPGEDFDVIGSIFGGQTALVTGVSFDSLWWRVICPDDSVGDCWVSADPALTTPVGSADGFTLPSPDTLTMTSVTNLSPGNRWQATASQSEPVLAGEMERFYASLTISDGSTTWTPVAEWRPYGLGYLFPAVVTWSRDGRYLYYTNHASPDGCALFLWSNDLYRLDVTDGSVVELVPPGSSRYLAISPDESKVAYTSFADNRVILQILDLQNGSERRVSLTERDEFAQSGGIVWSPDSSQLLLTLAYEACQPGWSQSIVRVDLDDLSATVLIDKDVDLPTTTSWSAGDTAVVTDGDGRAWLLDVNSGELSPAS